MRWCIFIHFFIFFGFIGFIEGHKRHCNPSCGGLQIRYPFRLKEDPRKCGDPSYELTCSGNRTLMEFQSTQFLVKHISYEGQFIQLIEVGLLRSNCSLPLIKSLSPSFFSYNFQYDQDVIISFMNCSKNLTLPNYHLIPYLSQKDSYVYGFHTYRVLDLAPSCSFWFMIPTIEFSFDPFQDIRNGFFLSWSTNDLSAYTTVRRSLRNSLRSSKDVVEKFLQTQQSLSPTRYSYMDIIAITRHFKEQLGRGGFGSVYKGELPGGHFVAVKVLVGGSKCQGDDFISEVSTIGRIHHLNIVRLVGFCSEGSKRALVYEFMPNKSLDKFIFSSNRSFAWQKLSSIALGVARGIDYLHRGCDMMILHFDIKPQNILLDRSFIPKVSDFGLAKLYPKEYNVVSVSVVRGTIGYIAPELVSRSFGVISHKSDVFSFGMLLMEMAAGRRNVDVDAGSSNQNYFPSLVYDKLKLDYSAEEGIKMESFEMNEVEKKLCLVGLWCIQIRPFDRPSMRQVVDMIEGDVDAIEFPPKPFFSCSSSISRTLHSDDTATSQLTVIEEDDAK